MNIIRNIRFFILAALCANSLNALASEYRPRHSVPQYNNKAHSKGFFLFSPFIIFGKCADALPHIHMPQFGKLFENIDFSCAIDVVQEHKVMLSAAGALVVLSLLAKRLQQSEMCGKWLSEKYTHISTSVDDYTNDCIKKCPLPVQLAITPVKILIQFLCNAIKKCIAMNQKKIVFSVAAPVAGRILDSLFVCPIPLFNFTSIGGMVSGGIITKGYFDSSFDKVNGKLDGIERKINEVDENNIAQHTATQDKIGMVQSTIVGMRTSITNLFDKIRSLDTGVGQIKEQVGNVSGQVKDILQKLVGMDNKIVSLQKTIEAKDKKNSEQYEDLKRQLEELQKSHKQAIDLLEQKTSKDAQLMLELQEFKSIYESNHENLRKDLGATSIHLSQQIDGVKEDVRAGFASQNRYLDSSKSKDVQITLLKLEASQRSANNS